MPDIKQIKKFALEAQGLYKVLKGGGIAAGSAALTVATIRFFPEFLHHSPEFVALITAVYGVAINVLRKFLLTYNIDLTHGK
jgi:predicted transcriptional regulator